MRFAIIAALALLASPAIAESIPRGPVSAGTSGLEVPRFVSLGSGKVYMRSGPGQQYPINWLYKRAYLPVIVTAEFDVWRRIKDPDGAEGWVHGNLLSGRRMGYVTGELRNVYKDADVKSPVVIKAEPGVLGRLEDCNGTWCKISILHREGWIRQEDVWGTFTGERFE